VAVGFSGTRRCRGSALTAGALPAAGMRPSMVGNATDWQRLGDVRRFPAI
jgi:hypothetical protein